jgi:hypothetical protein
MVGQWGVIGWGNNLSNWSGVSSIGWGDNLGNWGNSRGDSLNTGWGTVDDGVETVDWIGGVVDGSQGTIGFDELVLSSDDISITGFVLVLVVSGDGIMDRVAEAVLWMWVVWLRGDGLDNGRGHNLGHWGGVSSIGWGYDNWASAGGSQESGESDELKREDKSLTIRTRFSVLAGGQKSTHFECHFLLCVFGFLIRSV